MENIKFEITEKQIKDYLKRYKEYYKYCGPLFVKYMKDTKLTLTYEMANMLGLVSGRCVSSSLVNELPKFDPKPSIVNNLDLSGICHILIPTMKYYNQENIHINYLYANLAIVSDNLLVPMDHPVEIISSTLDDYKVCEKIETNDMRIKIKMSREHCRKELLVYQDYYGEDKVKKIRKIIREEMIRNV